MRSEPTIYLASWASKTATTVRRLGYNLLFAPGKKFICRDAQCNMTLPASAFQLQFNGAVGRGDKLPL